LRLCPLPPFPPFLSVDDACSSLRSISRPPGLLYLPCFPQTFSPVLVGPPPIPFFFFRMKTPPFPFSSCPFSSSPPLALLSLLAACRPSFAVFLSGLFQSTQPSPQLFRRFFLPGRPITSTSPLFFLLFVKPPPCFLNVDLFSSPHSFSFFCCPWALIACADFIDSPSIPPSSLSHTPP